MTQSAKTKDDPPEQGYKRPARVEAQIAAVKNLAPVQLIERANIRSPAGSEHLLPETLVYLTRRALKTGEQKAARVLLAELTERCFRILRNRINADAYADRDTICEDIIGEFVVLFAKDCAGQKTPLDFYECRFNRAFRGLRIDRLRTEDVRKDHIVEMPTARGADNEDFTDDVAEIVVEALRAPPNQETAYIFSRIADAVKALPTDLRDAFVLVRILGYKTHSKNPDEVTAAVRCKCSDRMIRYRLKQADAALAPLLEDLHDKS